MIALAEIELHRQWIDFDEDKRAYSGVKTASLKTIEELISADTDKKLREFTAQWFPFMDYWKSWEHPDFEDEVRAVSDTRDLMLLVLEFKRMVDEDECSRSSFEKLGVTFSRGGTEKHESASINYLPSSDSFARYMRATTNGEKIEEGFKEHLLKEHPDDAMKYINEDGSVYCPWSALFYATKEQIVEDHLYLNNQEKRVAELESGERHPAMHFFGGNLLKSHSHTASRAMFFLDSILAECVQGMRVRVRNGAIVPSAENNFTSLWICLSETFRESHVIRCQTCGLPVIVTGERGTKRLYCDDTCKRKYKRALKFASLVKDENMAAQDAAKEAGIAASTAIRILERNRIKVNLAQ